MRQFNCANRRSRKSTAHFGAYPTTTGGSVQPLLSAPIELDILSIVSLLIASNSAHKFALIAELNDLNEPQSHAFKSSNNSRKLSCSSAFGRMEKIAHRNISWCWCAQSRVVQWKFRVRRTVCILHSCRNITNDKRLTNILFSQCIFFVQSNDRRMQRASLWAGQDA